MANEAVPWEESTSSDQGTQEAVPWESNAVAPVQEAPAEATSQVPWESVVSTSSSAPPVQSTKLDTPDMESPLDGIAKWLKNVYSDPFAATPMLLDPHFLLRAGEPVAKLLNKVGSGMTSTVIDTLRAPGEAVQAFQDLGAEKKFEPTWKAPVSSMLVGSSRLLKRLEDEVTLPPDPQAGLVNQLPEAFGSALAFMGMGALGGEAGFGPALTTATLGGAVGATQQYDDAVAHGANPEQAAIAYVGGAAFGTTEAIPGAYFLGKLNKLMNGAVTESINKLGINAEHSILMETIKGMFEEGIQEGVQQVGNNWVARDLAGYDPSRSLGENFWSNVITGGLVGSFIGGGLALARKSEVNSILKAKEADRNLLLGTGNPINFIDGDFTPVGDLINLQKMQADIDSDLNDRADAAYIQGAGTEPISGIIPAERQYPNFLGAQQGEANDLTSTTLDKPINTKVERAIPATQEDGSPTTVRQALALTPIVAVDSNPYAELIKHLDARIAEFEDHVLVLQDAKQDTAKTDMLLNLMKSKRLSLIAKAQIADRLVAQIKSYAAVFTKVLNPDTKLVITGSPSFDGQTIKGTAGFFTLTHDITAIDGKPTPVGTLYVDLDHLATEIYNNKKAGLSEGTHQARRAFFETLNHELGHSIAIGHVAKMYRDAQSQDPATSLNARKALALMTEEYRNWLGRAAQSKQSFLLLSQFAPERAKATADVATTKGNDLNADPMTAPFPKGMKKDYLLSFDEFFAEMTARLATQGAFADEVMTKYFAPAMKQYQTMFEHMPAFAKTPYASDWKKFLESRTYKYKVNEELEKIAAGGGKDIISVLRHGLTGFDPEAFAGLREHLDVFDKLISWGFNLMQLAKANPHVEHLQSYLQATAAWSEYQRNFQLEANEVYKKWRALGKIEAAQLYDVLRSEDMERTRYDDLELSKRLTSESLEIYTRIREQLDNVLAEMRAVALSDAARTIIGNEELLKSEIEGINADFDKLGSQGYFPSVRFGKYTITARAKEDLTFHGKAFKKGQLISFPAFENEKERDALHTEMQKELGSRAAVSASIMRETDFAIQGMPRSLLRALRGKLENTGDFTPEMAAAFERTASEAAPFSSFRKHLLKKKGIEGYSEDGLRSFAYYIRSAAGHIARVKFSDALREPIAGLQQDVEVIKETGGRAQERQEMRHWLDRHFSYIMNPANEYAALRGVGFVAYLGMNVKSALINGTQLITTVGPYLASRYGDAAAISEMTKATWTLKDWIANRKNFIDALPSADEYAADPAAAGKKENSPRARLARMIERGKHEGWLDQSLATELAIAASENNLDRGLYLPKARRFWHEVSRYSALPFHLVEKMNRYITAIAAYNLEHQVSGDHEKAVLAARQANWTANYENARWNRPEFMRGKKSVFFLFANYLQNTLHFATHDPGASRYFLSMLLLAGFMGLPGAEDIADLVDFTTTYLSRLLGIKNPKTQIRRELREHLEELGVNPDLILHGLSQDTFGLGHVGELTGIPIPHLDASRSVGMGDVLPLTEVPSMFLQADPNDILVTMAKGAAGASGNIVEQFYRNLMSDDPNEWKKAERLLPVVAAKNVLKAARLAKDGKEITASGDVIATFDPHDLRDQLELIGQGLGFSPSRLTLGWEREIAARDEVQYYKVQQEGLLRQLDWAWFQEDREAKADVLAAVRKYNEQVPRPEMGLSTKTIKASLKSYLEKQVMGAAGVEGERKYRRLRADVESSYPDPVGKKNRDEAARP